jgi:5-methylcytosine-specific restriction endonuclease McrA
LDHIIPVADGGEHTEANCQCAHHRCNMRKGRRGRAA